MPEGDTIHRAARTLHTALSGQRVERFESVLAHLTRVDADTPIAGTCEFRNQCDLGSCMNSGSAWTRRWSCACSAGMARRRRKCEW